MKTTKGKKGGKKNRKSLARYKSVWVKGKKGKNIALIMEKPDAPTTPLKESAKGMMEAFPHTYGDVIEPEISRKQQRAKASVTPITDAKKLHSVTTGSRDSPTKQELGDQIAKLEAIVNNAASSIEDCEFVGPPKPELSVVQSTPQVEDVRKSTPAEPVLSQEAANEELHSVTTHHNGDYNYEELAELCDLYQIEIMQLKVGYDNRIGLLNEHINELGRALHEERQSRNVAEFNAVSSASEDKMRKRITYLNDQVKNMQDTIFSLRSQLRLTKCQLADAQKFNAVVSLENEKLRGGQNLEVSVLELQDDLQYLRTENQDLRKEIDLLMYAVDQHNQHYKHERNKSEATLKTLSNQFHTYMSLHKDDPVRNFLRYSGYGIQRTAELRNHFDKECAVRVLLSEERKVYRKWAGRHTNKVGKALRIMGEIRALRSIGLMAACRRPEEIIDWHCKKLTKLHSVTDVGARNIYDSRLRPLASNIDHDDYCKVWAEFKAVIPRAEFEALLEHERKEKIYQSVKDKPLFKVVKATMDTGRKIRDVLNYELNSNKRNEAMRVAMIEAKHKAEQASSIKRMREQEFEESVNKDTLRRRMLGLPDNV